MAGVGRAPKLPEQRVNRVKPERGEWVFLEPLMVPVLPKAGRGWSASAKRMWAGWRMDPITALYGPSELAAVWELGCRWGELADNEQRLRTNDLGLSLKGKQDRRVRLVLTEPEVVEPKGPAEVRQLRAV